MKNILLRNKRNIAVLLAVFALSASCNKLIEIPPAPVDKITEVLQLSDSSNVMNAVAGVYSYNSGSGVGIAYGNCQGVIAYSHSADELSPGIANPINQEFYSFGVTTSNATVTSVWQSIYKCLFPINTIINTIPSSTTMSQSFIKQITSEMKLMRAFYYFDMVNQFGGVPLVLSTDYEKTGLLQRASVDEVYAQILKDLTEARDNLKPTYPSAGRLRPNLYTALALLSKVHLYRQDWQSAYDEANLVIKSGIYGLESDLNRVFVDGSNEAIWQIPALSPANPASGTVNEALRFVPTLTTVVPNFILTPFLLTALGVPSSPAPPVTPADQRLTKWTAKQVVTVAGVPQTYYYPFKYKNRLVTATPVEDYMMFRLGEVYLIRAEAAAQLNKLTEALADVNLLRTRAGLPGSTASSTSQSAVLNAVMKERQTELFTEWGNRWFDLKRTGTAGTVLSAVKSGWKPEAALYPIPLGQVTIAGLTQNPGY